MYLVMTSFAESTASVGRALTKVLINTSIVNPLFSFFTVDE